jgi:hypothetical protein
MRDVLAKRNQLWAYQPSVTIMSSTAEKYSDNERLRAIVETAGPTPRSPNGMRLEICCHVYADGHTALSAVNLSDHTVLISMTTTS